MQTLSFQGDVLRIGRMKENDIVIDNISVSRFHAVLKLEGGGEFPAVEFLPSGEMSAYQWVIAIGYPYNIGGAPTVSEGIISALGRSIRVDQSTVLTDVIQTTAAVNPGNSGGPLVDLSGRVVGINTAIVAEAENIGFAISVATIEDFIQGLASS